METSKIVETYEQGGALKPLIKALIMAQGTMDPVVKDSKNAHFGNAYADINSILATVLPALRAEGVLLTQHIGWDNDGQLATVTTALLHEEGGWIRSTAKCPIGGKQDPQKTMAATTYLRRYGIQAALGLPAVDDDGNRAAGHTGPDLRAFLENCRRINGSIDSLRVLSDAAEGFGFQQPLEQMSRETLRDLMKRIKEETHG